MSEWKIPSSNWPTALWAAIDCSVDGDIIVILNEAMRELGEEAKERMCPNKEITFEVRDGDPWEGRGD